MYRRALGITTVGSIAALGLMPDEYYPGSLKPVAHMLNIASAGMKMAYVYKFSTKDMRQKHIEASGYLRQGLRKNGGIYIKLGQLIATLDVIVPDEYRNSMMQLTRGCEISPFEEVRAIVEGQLNRPLEQVFSLFQTTPISSASIGQVHKGILRQTGEEVAIKVQHANLAENVILDLKLMRGFVSIAKFMFKDFKYEWLIEEFDKNIHKELNFNAEAANLLRMKKMLEDEKIKNITVPRIVIPPTKKLLVMEFINGLHVDELEAIKQKGINAKQMGKIFSEIIVKMIHKYGFVHADPHSGNILLRKDKNGNDQLVLLDHGLYQQLDTELRQSYNRFWLGLILNNEEMYVKAASQLGTKQGVLLCCMLTSQTRDELASPDRNIFDLNPNTDQSVILKHATQWQEQIVQVLNELRRQILLLLKVNQFARAIQNMLGGRQMGVYQDIAKNCVENLPFTRWQRYKIYWSMYWAKRK